MALKWFFNSLIMIRGWHITFTTKPRSMSENVVARFIEPNKLGNYNLTPQYIGVQNMTLAFVGQLPILSVNYFNIFENPFFDSSLSVDDLLSPSFWVGELRQLSR